MSTKGTITEQAKRRIKGGNPSVASGIWDEEIQLMVGQLVGQMLKLEHFSVNLPAGETIPSGAVLAAYSDIVVEKWKDRSRAKLPATPINLPRNMGCFHVGPNDDPDDWFIPLHPGQGALIKDQPLLNDLSGRIAYELLDGYAVMRTDITNPDPNIPVYVMMKLVVMDMSTYGLYDLLPIPQDMEAQIIDAVVERFLREPLPDKVVDSTSEPTKTQTVRQ